jgi:hypothetical protein
MPKQPDQFLHDEINRLMQANPLFTDKDLVELARPVDSPLHDYIEWDEKKNAEQHWLLQTKELLDRLGVPYDDDVPDWKNSEQFKIFTTLCAREKQFYVEHPTSKGCSLIFLDSTGYVDSERCLSLEEAGFHFAGKGRPTFEICYFSALDPNGNCEDASLDEAFKNACDERIRFYQEREKEYGPDAWPKSA